MYTKGVKIPKAVIDTLQMDEGDKVIIKFDAEKRKLIIEEDKKRQK